MLAFRFSKFTESFNNLFFSEFFKLRFRDWQQHLSFRVFLYLKKYKKYWMPLVFWVGVMVVGSVPHEVQPLGGRKITRLCLIYNFTMVPFINFIFRLILHVFPKKTWIPERLSCFENQNIIVFSFGTGKLDTKFFWRHFLRNFMKRYRVGLYNNCVWRVFAFNFFYDLFDFENAHALKFLTAMRLPLFQTIDFLE